MKLQTALIIIPPPEVQIFTSPLREKYDPEGFATGPAHITLIYPFVEEPRIEEARVKLTSLCSEVEPFTITLDRYGRFPEAYFLAPLDPRPIISLHRLIFDAFPDYPPYEGEFGDELIPHLTLATFNDSTTAELIKLPPTPTFTFTVDRIHMHLGPAEGHVSWIPVDVFHLGAKA
ncbi:MAG: hypothetical protein GTO18_20925 [Anaerolineales bacterium]|nr:hypothetical protein [Anaerolineales bacterium]